MHTLMTVKHSQEAVRQNLKGTKRHQTVILVLGWWNGWSHGKFSQMDKNWLLAGACKRAKLSTITSICICGFVAVTRCHHTNQESHTLSIFLDKAIAESCLDDTSTGQAYPHCGCWYWYCDCPWATFAAPATPWSRICWLTQGVKDEHREFIAAFLNGQGAPLVYKSVLTLRISYLVLLLIRCARPIPRHSELLLWESSSSQLALWAGERYFVPPEMKLVSFYGNDLLQVLPKSSASTKV